MGHTDGTTCISNPPDVDKLITGGNDNTVRFWDLRQKKQTSFVNFDSQIFSLGCSPKHDNWIAVGLVK